MGTSCRRLLTSQISPLLREDFENVNCHPKTATCLSCRSPHNAIGHRCLRQTLGGSLALNVWMREQLWKARVLSERLLQGRRQTVASSIPHRDQIPDCVREARVIHVHQGTVTIAVHAKFHLWATLPVAARKLKEGVAHKEWISWRLCQLDSPGQIVHHITMNAVILTDEYWYFHLMSPKAAVDVLFQHHVRHLVRLICGVEAMHKAGAEGLHQVVLRLVVDGWLLRPILQAFPELFHLPQGWSVGMHLGIWEHREGPGDGQSDGISSDSHVLFSLQNRIKD
mmetsp:Transcript_70254/g.111007  ORF Transcript_70254/g.111007 Transcript_70254/m.111007 type:complete len:282 (-) Transcript_70254:98-943(-)